METASVKRILQPVDRSATGTANIFSAKPTPMSVSRPASCTPISLAILITYSSVFRQLVLIRLSFESSTWTHLMSCGIPTMRWSAISFISVVLPAPFCPTTPYLWFFFITRLVSRRRRCPAPYMRSRLSTYRSVWASSAPPATRASNLSPSAALVAASATSGSPASSALPLSPAKLMPAFSWSARAAAILAPVAFRLVPSMMVEAAISTRWLRTSSGSMFMPTCDSRKPLAPLAPPLNCLLNSPVSSTTPSGRLPATTTDASLFGTRPSGGGMAKRAAFSGSSPAGASISPAFTSSSVTLPASVCAPGPSSPLRIRASSFWMAGAISFWTFGAPPAVFQMPFAFRFTPASGSDLMMKIIVRRYSRVSFEEQSSVVSRSCPNFLCSRIFSAVLPSSPAARSRTVWLRCSSSGVLLWRVTK
mmetsp:Transcript_80925/g.229235  ORF Transcript_80925/g.229235 Transcript_80925/m.229235 type:complete len:419 (+) Transcript_80925:287-1543(+)